MTRPLYLWTMELLGWQTLALEAARRHRRPDGSFTDVGKYVLAAIEEELVRVFLSQWERMDTGADG